jgi:hypothetical protein
MKLTNVPYVPLFLFILSVLELLIRHNLNDTIYLWSLYGIYKAYKFLLDGI